MLLLRIVLFLLALVGVANAGVDCSSPLSKPKDGILIGQDRRKEVESFVKEFRVILGESASFNQLRRITADLRTAITTCPRDGRSVWTEEVAGLHILVVDPLFMYSANWLALR